MSAVRASARAARRATTLGRVAAALAALALCVAAVPRAANATSSATSSTNARAATTYELVEILAAIRHVESGGTLNSGRDARGDGGRALGPYQIHRAYWVDSRLAGSYQDCGDPVYARRVVLAYWRRWCPDALARRDAETLARVHNGGPDGGRERATLAYWDKVRRRLDASRDATPRRAERASAGVGR